MQKLCEKCKCSFYIDPQYPDDTICNNCANELTNPKIKKCLRCEDPIEEKFNYCYHCKKYIE